MKELQSWDDVPVFATEDDERAFWDTHCLGDALLGQLVQSFGDVTPNDALRAAAGRYRAWKRHADTGRWRELSEGSHD